MSIQSINLRKLLRLFFAPDNLQISLLRADIRNEIAKAEGFEAGGGDFYVPFWRDAKDHTIGIEDLSVMVRARIDANERRGNLYPRLQNGFLLWWNERRRWTNEPFEKIQSPKGNLRLEELNAIVKIENFLSLRGSQEDVHYVYPYFSPNPELNKTAAKLGLWAISETGIIENNDAIRLLDVIRGTSFAISDFEFDGTERSEFLSRYQRLISNWKDLWSDYE